MNRIGRGIGCLLGVAVCFGCASLPEGGALGADAALPRYDWQQPRGRCILPEALEEASGLETLDDRTLITHHDNGSTLWRIDLASMWERPDSVRPLPHQCSVEVLPGAPQLDGDFEGVTRHGSTIYLLRSPGNLYRAELRGGARALRGRPDAVTGGGGGRCNFEGVAAWGSDLLLACKYPREPVPDAVLLYRVHPAQESAEALEIDVGPVLDALRLRRLRPSGLAALAGTGRLLVLVGKERIVLEVDVDSAAVVAWQRLARRHHRQAEGIALMPGGEIAIVDEADGRRATLTVYGERPGAP